ncbi:hypothetical protein [Sphingomonas aracearum]|uniref:Uncharacterized protein n=1 Tax=Sphingomonas aracearum TaxID=2283317 RepID=A0A369VVW9_9SPHN|nr:hypothetical protein [Sphingomonas aracearum]RDE06488.1 hypothetical protein DVW87_01880 [Sphingomonas aracearum]
MSDVDTGIDQEALDESLSVNPGSNTEGRSEAQDAGRDESIQQRLDKNPENKQARLDRALDESMDASDPPATTQPVHSHEPPASSGYDPEAEARIAGERK